METRSHGARITVAFKSGHGVVQRWASQYEGTTDQSKQGIAEALKSIPNDDPDRIAALIGNKSWTHPLCDNCQQYVDSAWVIEGYDKLTTVCLDCTQKALGYMGPAALRAARGEQGEG